MKIPKAMVEPPRDSLVRQNLRALFSSDKSNKVDDHLHDDDDKDNDYYEDDDQEQADDYQHHHRRSECSSSYFPSPNSTYMQYNHNNNYYSYPNSTASSPSPYLTPSPLIQLSPYQKSPWNYYNNEVADDEKNNGLIGSLYREEGHIYSIASCGGLLYTGSESRNIRVWKNMQEFSGFKSSSGLVKAIVVLGGRIFTGHQDGKIRVWRARHGGGGGVNKYARVGTLPTTRDMLVKSVNPKSYVVVRRRKKVPWIRHYDAVSCLCVDRERGLLYSGSWDKTLKVWRVSDFKCLESIPAHDDAVNSVATASGGLLFTGSADGTVKSWRRELVGKSTRHVLVETLLRQDHAVTSLAASSPCADVLYAGSSDGLVNFWAASGEKHSIYSHGGALRGHKLAVLCLAVAGERLVMSGSADSSICVWRWDAAVGSHSFVSALAGPCGPVKCLAVEDDAAEEGEEEWEKMDNWVVYSGSLDRSVKVWRVSDQVRSLSGL